MKVYCDGGARGNPGPAGAGVVVVDKKGAEIKKYKKFLGEKTNNQAEYEAVLFALESVLEDFPKEKVVDFFLDSELVVNQLKQNFKIKNEELGSLLIKIHNLIVKNNLKATFTHVPREKNHSADKLVNEVIEEYVN